MRLWYTTIQLSVWTKVSVEIWFRCLKYFLNPFRNHFHVVPLSPTVFTGLQQIIYTAFLVQIDVTTRFNTPSKISIPSPDRKWITTIFP